MICDTLHAFQYATIIRVIVHLVTSCPALFSEAWNKPLARASAVKASKRYQTPGHVPLSKFDIYQMSSNVPIQRWYKESYQHFGLTYDSYTIVPCNFVSGHVFGDMEQADCTAKRS